MKNKVYRMISMAATAAMLATSVPVMGADAFSDDSQVVFEQDATMEVETEEIEGAFLDGSETEAFEDGEIEPEFLDEAEEPVIEEGVLAGEVSGGAPSAGLIPEGTGVTNNVNLQNYMGFWASPVHSHLVSTDSGYMRVECQEKNVLVEYYDQNYNQVSEKKLPIELKYFGGFHAGSDANYLIFGQSNPKEDNSQEVIRVVKYDKNWNRLGAASLRGANTTVPFNAGSLRVAEYGGYLYIRTCHEMYMSDDGLNHQSNLTMQVRTSDMNIVDSYYEVMNPVVGYVSHSFNQYIIVDDAANIVALDHGDAIPRSALLGKYHKKAGQSGFTEYYNFYDFVNVIEYEGPMGYNYTGASVGGLEYSDSSYLTAGSSVPQDENFGNHDIFNVYVTATSRNNFTESGTSFKWITGYKQGGKIAASTPHLVKINGNRFLLLWAEVDMSSYFYNANGKICYTFLDGAGNQIGGVYKKAGYLSDCKPVVKDGAAVWYVTDGKKLTFYKVNGDGSLETHTGRAESQLIKVEREFTKTYGDKDFSLNAKSVNGQPLTYKSSDSSVIKVSSKGKVTITGAGTAYVTVALKASGNQAEESVRVVINVNRMPAEQLKVIYTTFKDIDMNTSGFLDYLTVWDGKRVLTSEDVDIEVDSASCFPYYLKFMNGRIKGRGNYTGVKEFEELWVLNPETVVEEFVNTSKGPKLTWKKEAAAAGYVIYRKIGNGKYKRVKTITNSDITSWTDTKNAGPKSDSSYYVRVFTKTKTGKTVYNKKSDIECAPARPAITSLKKQGKAVKITFKGSKEATGYLVQRYDGHKWKTIGQTGKTVYTDNKLPSNLKTVKYRVRARRNTDLRDSYSLFSSAKTIKR